MVKQSTVISSIWEDGSVCVPPNNLLVIENIHTCKINHWKKSYVFDGCRRKDSFVMKSWVEYFFERNQPDFYVILIKDAVHLKWTVLSITKHPLYTHTCIKAAPQVMQFNIEWSSIIILLFYYFRPPHHRWNIRMLDTYIIMFCYPLRGLWDALSII